MCSHRPHRNSSLCIAAALACVLSTPVLAGSTTADWPGFRGPNGNGQITSGLPGGEGALQLRIGWQRPIGSGYSGIAVVDGVAVTAGAVGERDRVLAFNPRTGEDLWSFDLDARTVGLAGSKDGPISTPAIADGRVFLVSTQGRLVALDLAEGELLWSVHLVNDLGSTRPAYGFSTSPVVAGDIVVVQSGGDAGSLAGLEAESGEVRWRAFVDRHYAQSPIVTELAGRQQVVTIGSSRVVGIDPATGEELWSHDHGGAGEFGAESSSPMPVGGDRLFVKHDNERSLVLHIAIDREEQFQAEVVGESRTMTRSYAPPTVWDGAVYGYTSRFLSACDLESGEQLWRSRDPGDGFLVAVDGVLLVANKNDGTVHLGNADAEGWSEIDQLDPFDDLVWTPPTFAEGALFVRSLTEMARVDIVRTAATSSGDATTELPLELDVLRSRIAAGGDPKVLVDELLDGLDGPLVDGDRVLFLWRGDAEEVGIAGDMFGFRYDESMQRLEGTDLFWKQLTLDRRGRFNYVYFPDYRPALDPLNPRSVESTAMGPDLNHRADEALQMSWFAMPEWPGNEAGTVPATTAPPAPDAAGRLETFDVAVALPERRGPAGPVPAAEVSVPVTVWLPPGYDTTEGQRYPVVFSLERYAVPIGNWPATLDAVVGDRVAPLIAVMLDPPSEFYGRRGGGNVGALVPAILAAVDQRYRTIAEPEGRAVVGALYTGPPAIALSLGENRLFGKVAVQSPFAIDVMLPMFEQQIARAAGAPAPEVFYFEWAHWDMRSRLEGLVLGDFMEDLHDLFEGEGYELVGGEVWDSTDWAGWRNRTDVILEALFPSERGDAVERLAPWLVGADD